MKKLIANVAVAASAFIGAGAAMAAPIVVSFSSSAINQHINVGEAVTIDVRISGLGDEVLSGYDLNFLYSGAVLKHVSTDESSVLTQLGPWGPMGSSPIVLNDLFAEGNLGMFATAVDDDVTLSTYQLDSFLLFSFQMTGFADGVTTFGLGSDPDFQRNFLGLSDTSGFPATLNVDVGGVCVAVGAGQCSVPEPTTYALVGLGLFAAFAPAALRRRKAK